MTEFSGESNSTLAVEVVQSRNTSSAVTTRTSLDRTRTSVVLRNVVVMYLTGDQVFHQHSVHGKLFPPHTDSDTI